jgi:hypothetical protein
VVTGWERIGREVKMGRDWMRRNRKNSWKGEQWIVAQEEDGK